MTILENIAAELDQRDAHIRTKIAQFKKLLRDPEIGPSIERALSNGHSRKLSAATSRAGSRRKDGAGIRRTIRGLRSALPKQFTVVDVVKVLEARHFKFLASDHKNAVRDALATLVKDEVLNVVRPAQGSEPQVYEFAAEEKM